VGDVVADGALDDPAARVNPLPRTKPAPDLLAEHVDGPAVEAGLDDAEGGVEGVCELCGSEDVLEVFVARAVVGALGNGVVSAPGWPAKARFRAAEPGDALAGGVADGGPEGPAAGGGDDGELLRRHGGDGVAQAAVVVGTGGVGGSGYWWSSFHAQRIISTATTQARQEAAMKLVSFSVKNYRSITTAYKLPLGDMTVLIGPNNDGKSNILRALSVSLRVLTRLSGASIARGRVRGMYETQYDWSRDFPVKLQPRESEGCSTFGLEFELSDDEVEAFRQEIKSKLDGRLPIELRIGPAGYIGFKVVKKGPGGPALSKKAARIAGFVARRLDSQYIPAVRTAEAATYIVEEMVERSLSVLEQDANYKVALAAVTAIQRPILDEISKNIRETLAVFLPEVKDVAVEISDTQRSRAFRRAVEINVDDGTLTSLELKGDGVQSLAALSLMRHASETWARGRELLLLLEEPESHLHPLAIHKLRGVLKEISAKNQTIITTHCPLYVDRANVKANVIVTNNKAASAKSVDEIRKILGVRTSDNLRHAEIVLVVEGEDDRVSVTSLLRHFSSAIRSAIDNGTVALDSLHGAGNLGYQLGLIRDSICSGHAFLDDDKAAREAASRAMEQGIVSTADLNFAMCDGLDESELEDLYDSTLYFAMVRNSYLVDLSAPAFKSKAKWSDRTANAFRKSGKQWNDKIKAEVKMRIAELVASSPGQALHPARRAPFDGLVSALEARISQL
jgi:ABC-type cobalamin/Fe3+-siderophores transport system ATPase subunit